MNSANCKREHIKNLPQVFVVNSNPWFSAVSAYALEFSCYLNHRFGNVTVFTQRSSPLVKKCAHRGLPWMPWELETRKTSLFILLAGIFDTLRFVLLCLVRCPKFLFVFEGREHTLCGMIRFLLFPLMYQTRIVRIRAQAQNVSNSLLSRFAYRYLCQRLIYGAAIVKERVPFPVPHAGVQLFCRKPTFIPKTETQAMQSAATSFLVLGRFDPIKGHREFLVGLLPYFEDLQNRPPIKIFMVGEERHLNIQKIGDFFCGLLRDKAIAFVCQEWNEKQIHINTPCETVQLILIQEHLGDRLETFMQTIHWGLIPSLGSEVICRVAVEFLQMGIPVMSSCAGALPEVQHQVELWLKNNSSYSYLKDTKNDLMQNVFCLVKDSQWAKAVHSGAQLAALKNEFALLKACALDAGVNCFSWDQYVHITEQIS